jgi:hypothetical protein
VKRLSADDSAGSRVKVGHCQATIEKALVERRGLFAFLSKNNPLDCVSLHRIASHRIASQRSAVIPGASRSALIAKVLPTPRNMVWLAEFQPTRKQQSRVGLERFFMRLVYA